MSFKKYIHSQEDCNSAIGDFIKDAKSDKDFPETITSIKQLVHYLTFHHRACDNAVAAGSRLFKEYKEYKKQINK
jgi:hypothetical protein